jgi:hypothetical protein
MSISEALYLVSKSAYRFQILLPVATPLQLFLPRISGEEGLLAGFSHELNDSGSAVSFFLSNQVSEIEMLPSTQADLVDHLLRSLPGICWILPYTN